MSFSEFDEPNLLTRILKIRYNFLEKKNSTHANTFKNNELSAIPYPKYKF